MEGLVEPKANKHAARSFAFPFSQNQLPALDACHFLLGGVTAHRGIGEVWESPRRVLRGALNPRRHRTHSGGVIYVCGAPDAIPGVTSRGRCPLSPRLPPSPTDPSEQQPLNVIMNNREAAADWSI